MVIFRGESSEIRLGIIAAALEQLLHFLPVGLTRAEARAGVADGVFSDFRQTPKKGMLKRKALRTAVRAAEDVRTIVCERRAGFMCLSVNKPRSFQFSRRIYAP